VPPKALDIPEENTSKDDSAPTKPQTIITKSNIPEFLPSEYLEDDSAEDNSSLSALKETTFHKSKKVKFIDQTAKKPKDRKKGSTIYRVVEAHGTGLLAPRAVRTARSVKEAWLSGLRGAGGNRKVINGGFFKNKR
jgi:U3 small nucleolar RNA-associated protein 16